MHPISIFYIYINNNYHFIELLYNFMNKSNKLFSYEIVKKIGEGAFGEVLLATKDGKELAIKKLSKKQIIKVNKLHEPFIEKQILYKLNDLCKNLPYFIKIYETQSDEDNMYLIIEYCSGGTLQNLILNEELSAPTIKKIAAKLLLILEKLHELKVIHRDLKPSNFLLNEKGEIKLSDFGTAYAPDVFFGEEIAAKIKSIKEMNQQKEQKQKEKKGSEVDETSVQDRRSTFVGTACYMAPQLLANDLCGKEADIWAYGCILYEMTFKVSPFFDTSEGMVWKKILNDQIQIQAEPRMKNDQEVLKLLDLIKKILVKDTAKRLGSGPNGYKDLKKHPYFQGIDWEKQAVGGIQQVSEKLEESRISEISEKKVQKVILSGVVNKKMFFGNFKERMLILYSTPKLVYYCTETGDKKGEIPLLKQTPVGIDGKIFTITNEKKTYYFKSKTSAEWAEMIKSAILNVYY